MNHTYKATILILCLLFSKRNYFAYYFQKEIILHYFEIISIFIFMFNAQINFFF